MCESVMGESTQTDLINLKQEDFEKVCRCCLSQESLLNIFELNYEDLLICDIISQLFCIQVNFKDERPKNICETCIVQVIQFYQFKKNIETTEEILSTILEKKHILPSIKEEELFDDVPPELPLEDINFFKNLNECKIPKTEDENLQAETPNSVTQTDEKGAKRIRKFPRTAGNPKFVNKRYKRDPGPVQCPYCPEIFETASEYYTHRKRKLDTAHRRKHPCAVCGKLFSSNHMAQHMSSHHQGMHQCDTCQDRFKTRYSLARHKKRHIVGERSTVNKCEVCRKTFMDRNALKSHKISQTECHYLCSPCGKDFIYKHTYVYHMKKLHKGELQKKSPRPKPERYFCQKCPKDFKSKTGLENHVLAHNGKRFICEACGKFFFFETNLRQHFKAHHIDTKEKVTYTCTHCSLVFKHKSHYLAHVKSLSDTVDIKLVDFPETQYQCNVCSNYFANKSSLNNHMGIHSEIKILCSVCGKKFNSTTALKFHSKVHTGEKPYSCKYCDKKCVSSGALRSHTFTHTGERPYVCKVCSKGFTQGPKLKIHMRTHTGERPYVCQYCNKSFPTQSYLVIHIRSHTGETPYVCEVCSKGFNHSSSLKKHKQTHFKESQIKEGLELEFEECEEPILD